MDGGPALKAAAADPVGAFTVAAAKAGEEAEEGADRPTCEEAAADPGCIFTVAAAEAGTGAAGATGVEMVRSSLERVSATTLLIPAMIQMSEVYSAMCDS
jgi:hypothetical protein